ncbi:Seven TM Receptor [Caenorhabditis elegans]|uniref:Seven TM Receptor n=1 Tax=Caenorhabditis elegans TaxID=6239 RepID=O16396_CAEEL|nr:Seven TM Receptor [Caenorhabditis elegans]CCD64877.1 Seven TM Receptor [Caenorhabditis elegans]|eukprot:NP_504078.1 Seven TM Receptor [Caenorhabditis elegans]
MATWHTILKVVQYCSSTFSIFTNLLLIYLIFKKSPKTMLFYKYLLIFTSVFELHYGIIDLLIKPEIISEKTFWIAETNSSKSLVSMTVGEVLLYVWAAFYGVTLGNFVMHFCFRYLTITKNNRWVSGIPVLCFWLCIPPFFGICFSSVIYFCLGSTDSLKAVVLTKIRKFEKFKSDDMSFYGFTLYTAIDNWSPVNWRSIIGNILIVMLILIAFFIMIKYGMKTYWEIRKLSDVAVNTSELSKSLQYQLFISLVVQAIIPVLLIFVPATFTVLALLGKGREFHGHIISASIALFPAIDPLPVVIIIKPYRNAVIGSFKSIFSKQNQNIHPSTLHAQVILF